MEKLLLVDDSKFLKMAMKRTLSEAGFTVVDAANGQDALQLARETQPDLIILDMMLPGLGGEMVLRTLQQDQSLRNIPVVVVSSLSQSNAGKLQDEGAVAYIEKSKLELDKSDNFVRLVTAALRKSLAHA
jgi:two-component system chemotaxis response regulator CheY